MDFMESASRLISFPYAANRIARLFHGQNIAADLLILLVQQELENGFGLFVERIP